MALTTAGVTHLARALVGQGAFFNAANAHIGVGNGNDAFAVGQTDLLGASRVRKAMDIGYPVVSGPTVKFRSTFAPNEANFAWSEWGVFNAESGGTMLNRVVESNGTKQSNQTWVLEVDITFAVGK